MYGVVAITDLLVPRKQSMLVNESKKMKRPSLPVRASSCIRFNVKRGRADSLRQLAKARSASMPLARKYDGMDLG